MKNNWYNLTNEEVIIKLNSKEIGLTDEEVSKRLQKNGLNVLPEHKQDSVFKIFINEFKDPIVILLIFAIIASLIAKEVIDAIAILAIVLIDIIMGTYQENKANNTAEALKKLVTEKVKVLRNNEIFYIESKDLVIGDIVFLESGNKVSADLKILESHNLTIDESILTGESIQVEKNSKVISKENCAISEQLNMAFSGTTVVSGRAKAIVVETALNTEIGKIATSIHNTKEEKSPLTIRIEKFSKQISLLVLLVAVIIAVLLIIKDVEYHEIFLSVIALAVSAMPEGLPLALTMALTIASNKMARKNVIARKLNSIESLGSTTVIASDKTGTLTLNEQTAKVIVLPTEERFEITGVGYNEEGQIIGENKKDAYEIAFYGAINNEADLDKKIGDSIDLAFLALGKKANINIKDVNVKEIIPYESENKYSAVFYEKENDIFCTIKGSLEKVLKFCNNNVNIEKINKQNEELAKNGYRVIALACGKINSKDNYLESDIANLDFKGLVGFIDPIRSEAALSIKECKKAGIKVLMITGDHPLTAFSIAKDLDLTTDIKDVTNGEEVDEYIKKGEVEIDKFVKDKIVFTRVTPIQKLEIVNSLKRQKEFVAVTGDGVNDAPALKSANIGIAMGSGTDIARETSKMIILDDNFKSIVAGVKEGRVAYANIRKIIYFLISCGLAEVMFFVLSILFDLPMPLVAIQLLWLNVVTDGIQDFALSFEKAEKDIMLQKPRNPEEALFDKSLIREILIAGLTIGIIVFSTWYYLINIINMDVNLARGYIMALMVFIQNIHVFNCRSENLSAFKVSLKSNKLIVGGVFISILLQVIVMESNFLSKFLKTSSLPLESLVYLFLVAIIVLVVMEFYKMIIKKQ